MSFNNAALLTAFKEAARGIVLASEDDKWYTTVDKIVDLQLKVWAQGVVYGCGHPGQAGEEAGQAKPLVGLGQQGGADSHQEPPHEDQRRGGEARPTP